MKLERTRGLALLATFSATFLLAFVSGTLFLNVSNSSAESGEVDPPPGISRVFYVSPSGSNSNPGTLALPWQTMRHAAQTLQAGDMAVFEDGPYPESILTQFANSGTVNAPIILRSRNKHGAVITYQTNLKDVTKLSIGNAFQYITIQDFEFTQVEKSASITSDIMLQTTGQFISFIGNKVHHLYEDGIKTAVGASNILIEGNIVFDINHEGIDTMNTDGLIIRNNIVSDIGRTGILAKGGIRNALVYNNILRKETGSMDTAFSIGGTSDAIWSYDTAVDTGFEIYNSVFYNNIVYAAPDATISIGIWFRGSTDCSAYNNVVIGATSAFRFSHPNNTPIGWEWNPPNVNSIVKNNIIVDNGYPMFSDNTPTNRITSNNLTYNNANISSVLTSESGHVAGDPLFVDSTSDWRLQSGSPAIGAGTPMPASIAGYGGTTLKPPLIDFVGTPRTEPWDIGAFAVARGNAEVDIIAHVHDVISITTNAPDNKLVLDIMPTPSGTLAKNDLTVTVSTNNATGYTLSMNSKTTNTSLVHESATGSPLSPNIPSTTHPYNTPLALGIDTWGWNLGIAASTTTFRKIPPSDDTQTIRTTIDSTGTSDTTVTFGANVTDTTPTGTYMNTIVFTAVGNAIP